MNRTPITVDLAHFPDCFHPLLLGAEVYDSSCSPEAKVYYIHKDGGYYLKTAAKGALETEAKLTRYFYAKQLSAQVLAYDSGSRDFLLTRRIPGEDCSHRQYLDNPKRLCDTTAGLLRSLHDLNFSDCPVPNRMETYFAAAQRNYRAGKFNAGFLAHWGSFTCREAWDVIETNARYLQADTLLHGDYCLPNIMLDNWRFTGFLDLDSGGVGDRHIDLFWGTWTLFFNLKTDRYYDRFLDAYGRDRVEPELLRAIAACESFG